MLSPDVSNSGKTVEFKRPAGQEKSTQAAASGEPQSLQDPSLYINRELSLLSFQWRVLEEVQNRDNPLLEPFKFLAIPASNLDEFFMVRVAGLKRQLEAGSLSTGLDGMTPQDQLEAVSSEVGKLYSVAQQCLADDLLPALKAADIHLMEFNQLSAQQQSQVK